MLGEKEESLWGAWEPSLSPHKPQVNDKGDNFYQGATKDGESPRMAQ